MSNNKCLSSDLTKKIFSVFLDFEADCPLLDKRMQVERPLCDSGLQLRVSGYVRKVRQAVTLVLVVEKMKRPIGSLMKHVMEDQMVLEACLDSDSSRDWDSPWNLDIFWYSDGSRDWDSPWYLDILWYSGRSWFLDISWHPDSSQGSDSSWESARLSQEHVDEPHSISDIINNKWVLLFPPRLTAVMLVGIDLSQQVTLLVSTYIPDSGLGSGQRVTLRIKGTNYFLSCSGPPNSPVLKLETVQVPFSTSNPPDRFLFYMKNQSNTTSVITLESVQFRDWFISNNNSNERSPVAMCRGTEAAGRVVHFSLSSLANLSQRYLAKAKRSRKEQILALVEAKRFWLETTRTVKRKQLR